MAACKSDPGEGPDSLVVLRVKRRRQEDPVEAFCVQAKRARSSEDGSCKNPCRFQLLQTVEVTTANDEKSSKELGAKVREILREREALSKVDLKERQFRSAAPSNVKEKAKGEVQRQRSERRFELVKSRRDGETESKQGDIRILDFEEVTEPATFDEGDSAPVKSNITVNGQAMESVQVREEESEILNEDWVYDLYFRPGAIGAGRAQNSEAELQEVIQTLSGELLIMPDPDFSQFYNPSSDSFRLRTDFNDRDFDENSDNDSEDSNAEDHYGNDYPDEDDYYDGSGYVHDGQEYVDFTLDGLVLGDEVVSTPDTSEPEDESFLETAALHGEAYAKYKRDVINYYSKDRSGDREQEED